eukprot:SAG11_NODE_34868_length_269_cov_1.523529_1_plen_50_part_10
MGFELGLVILACVTGALATQCPAHRSIKTCSQLSTDSGFSDILGVNSVCG